MKTILSTLALTLALPTLAFAQANPPAGHDQHQGHMEHHGSKDCCEDKADCCEEAKADGRKADCCEKHAKGAGEKPAADPHSGHQGH